MSGQDILLQELSDRRTADKRRIAELEAKVTRLQHAYNEALIEIDWWPDVWNTMTTEEQWAEHRANGLQRGDLEPVKGDDNAPS